MFVRAKKPSGSFEKVEIVIPTKGIRADVWYDEISKSIVFLNRDNLLYFPEGQIVNILRKGQNAIRGRLIKKSNWFVLENDFPL